MPAFRGAWGGTTWDTPRLHTQFCWFSSCHQFVRTLRLHLIPFSSLDHHAGICGVQSIPLCTIRGHRKRQAETLGIFVTNVNGVYAEVEAGRSACDAAGVSFSTPAMVYEMGPQWNTKSCIENISRPTKYTNAAYKQSQAAESPLLWEMEELQCVWDGIRANRTAGSTYFSEQSETQSIAYTDRIPPFQKRNSLLRQLLVTK